jgi:chromosome segregation ATPase
MDPEAQERFEKVDLRLSEHDEKIIANDKSLVGIRNLLQTGMRMLADMETKISALVDSQTRLYDTVQQLAEAQKRTEESLRRFLDRSGNGHSS